jgi:putative tryptophan/tyrosine transport system substrate-binding protein
MDRRTFLAGTGAVLLAAPLAAEAQATGKIPRIGWLTGGAIHESNLNAFREGMRALGYSEVAIEFRAAAGHADRLPAFAAELVRLKVDLMLIDGGAAAVAAKRATSDVPVVVGAMGDPVRDGIVASLARPGGNITGFSISTGPELIGKRLDLIRETVPGLARVAVVWNESNPTSRLGLQDVADAAKTLGIAVVPLGLRDAPGISHAFGEAARSRVGAVLTVSDAFLWSQREHVVALAARYRLPAIYSEPEFVSAGGLIAYGPNIPDNFRRAAVYVDRILKGARPGDLPIEQPTKFDLVINLKTAKALGLTIPPSLLGRADEVIQ